MKKKIWLINQYAMPPKYEPRIQTLKKAQYLREFGHDVTIIAGSYLHNTDINLITGKKKYIERTYDGTKYIYIKTSDYKGNGIKRIYNLIEFPIKLLMYYKKFDRPDVIAHLATVPFGNIIYFLTKKLKAKFIVDIVDLWPETFVGVGLISKNNPLVKLAYRAEKWLYKKADEIVFTMEGGKDYIIEKGWNKEVGGPIDLNKVHYINNGVDLSEFDKNKELYKLEDKDLNNNSLFKIIYLGSIRLNNNIKLLVDAAAVLKNQDNIRFLIYGDGDDREFLIKYCEEKDITNVIFKQKWVDPKYVPFILSKSSLNILNYLPTPVWRFGGSQSKSFQYMASGKPICCNIKMGYCPITKFNLGIAKKFKNAKEYANEIMSFVDMNSEEYNEICKNARNASENYDYRKLTSDFERLVLS